MPYAEVSVNSPIAQRRTFSYGIPDDLSVIVGQAVLVPFGDKILQGIVMELTEFPAVEDTREIAGIIDPQPFLSPSQVALARWISSYYLAPLFETVALMLPPGFGRRVITSIEGRPDLISIPEEIEPEQKKLLEYIRSRGKILQKELEKTFGIRHTRQVLTRLINQQLVTRSYELEKVKVKPKMVSYLKLKINADEATKILTSFNTKFSKQAQLLQLLLEKKSPISTSMAKSTTGATNLTFQTLVTRGLIEIQEVRVDRDPLGAYNVSLAFPLSLTRQQEAALAAISKSWQRESVIPSVPEVCLLHGVTGSGKTEVYLRALEMTVKAGRRGLVLVPEISMTPQVIERFISRFPGRVAILHSELPLGEKFDEWWRIKNGEFDVVIGPRSAIFAPQPELGLIVIDEEHEWTYKQQEHMPYYHTREIAIKLAGLTGAAVVLGSATPDVESYYKAIQGTYRLLELTERVTPNEGAPLPAVEIVDLRKELKSGNFSLFSRLLFNSIDKALQNREQVLLFLNRRGAASFVECRDCGWVIRCKRCEVPLSYHFAENKLVCHQCNYRAESPRSCPNCHSLRIKYLGVGTEKLEQETARSFPGARILRWDSDVIGGHSQSHQKLFAKFRAGEADILIGTQMIAKGLDLPGVTVVGVISADIALNLPDFRAGERIFQLLSQVAGRAGRGYRAGKVIIQTYSPEHYAIKAAANHNYQGFYQQEITYRNQLCVPPFTHLVRLIFSSSSDNHAREETERIQKLILTERDARGLTGISLIGPAPAYIHRLRNRYRWQLILRAPNPSAFLSGILFPRGWILDIDPIGLS